MKLALLLTVLLIVGCATSHEKTTGDNAANEKSLITSIETQISKIDFMIQEARIRKQQLELSNIYEGDPALYGLEAEINNYELQKASLEDKKQNLETSLISM